MKKTHTSILKLLAVLIFAVIPVVFFGQEAEEEGDEEPAKQEQTNKRASFSRYGYINGNIGGVAYHGDVYAEPFLPDWDHFNWGFGAFGGWQFHPVIGVRADFGYSNLSGVRYGDVDKGFKGDVFDYSVNATISLINLIFGYNPDRWFDMTAWAGIGQAQYRTRLNDHTTGELLQSRGWGDDEPFDNGDNNGINKRDLVTMYPVGLNFDFMLSDHWNVNINSSLKFTDSDGLDAYEHAVAAVKKDFWHYTSVGLTYKFGQACLKKMEKNFDDITWTADPNPLEVHGDSIAVTITGEFPPKYFQTHGVIYLTPVLRFEDDTVSYEAFTVKGEDVAGDGTLISYKNGGTVTYTGKILYSAEMNVSELFLVPIIYCSKEGTYDTIEELLDRGKYTIMPDVKIADGVIHTSRYIFDDEIAIIAFHAYKKENVVIKGANIYFLVNRYNLNWKVPLNKLDANKEQLAAVNEFLTLGWKIKNIDISGWASPEGEELFNRDLSENRSTTTYDYMVKEMKKLAKQEGSRLKVEDPKEEVSWGITWQGPDWDGFIANVENSSLTDKQAILNVIKSADQSKREEEIRNMILIYPEIEEDMLPSLRRTEITVNCYEPKRSDEQIMAYGLTYPDSLKVDELLYTATFYDDDEDQLAIYKSVIENYPKCYMGYANAGEVLIGMGEYDEAGEMLDKANELKPNDAEIINNQGVLSCHLGEYDEAETYFLQAQDLGAEEDYNLAILAILDGDYSKAQNLMSGIECKHNLGLLQLLNKDYETAQKTLECAPPEAITYYLLAITGARQDNTQFLYDNLMKAIEMNAELKSQARDDREFLKYNELPEFQAIIQ